MPKSKRDRSIALTKTKKKGLEFKQSLISEIRECVDAYENLFIISIFNQRNNYLKDLRQQWSESKFLFGKNKVVTLAFGRSIESEYKEQLHKLCPYLSGDVGLLFTNSSKQEVFNFFKSHSCPDYARSGNIATEDVIIHAGPLSQFQHTMEPQLRQLGMHTSLIKGVVTLDTDHVICRKMDKLTPEQARLLKLFDIMQAQFKVNIKAYWSKTGEFEVFQNNEKNLTLKTDSDGNAEENDEEDNTKEVQGEEENEMDEDEPQKKKRS